LSTAATTTLLDRLEEKGYVKRERDPVDRRKVQVELTSEGQKKIYDLYGPLAREGSRMMARFSDRQLEMLREFLDEATETVDAHRTRLLARVLDESADQT
jgi:DNA-binding MarR family transcriptional regulator